MKKTLLLILAAVFSLSMSASVTLDFTTNDWGFPAGSSAGTASGDYSNGTYTVSISGASAAYWNTQGYFLMGTTGASMTLPAMNFAVVKIVVDGHSGASSSTSQNIYVGETAVSTETTDGAAKTQTYEIASAYQTSGTQYTLQVTNSKNTQITAITFYSADDEDSDELTLTGEGTADNPYTVADALAIIEDGSYTSDNVYVQGKVSKIGSLNTSYGELTYYISDDGTESEQLEIYNGYGLKGVQITSADYLSLNDEVIVCGPLTNYSGTYEMTYPNQIYSLNGVTTSLVTDMNDPYASNATEWTQIEHADVSSIATIGDNDYFCVKMGTSSADGSAYTTLPAGTTSFSLYAVAWNGTDATPYTITLEGIGEKSYEANANSGLHDSSPYTLTADEISADSDYHAITFDALTEATKLTVATTSKPYRIAIFGLKYFTEAIDGADTLDALSEDEEGDEEESTTISAGGLDTFENGGFEDWTDDGDPVGWVSVTTAGNGTISQSTDAHGGNYSAQLHHASSNKRLGSKEFLLPEGTYTVSFYAKSVDADGLAEIAAGYAPSDKGTTDMGSYVYGDYVYPSATEWENITWEFTLEEETQLNLVIMNNKNGGGDVLIDDYTITSGETGIQAVSAATVAGTGAMYNLSGQKVTESYRGIVIVDGKKVLNK